MKVIRTDDFEKSFRRVPKKVQELYSVQESRFRDDWRDPRLHVKRVKKLPGALSFRVTRRYRVFFYFHKEDVVVFYDIDHRKDSY